MGGVGSAVSVNMQSLGGAQLPNVPCRWMPLALTPADFHTSQPAANIYPSLQLTSSSSVLSTLAGFKQNSRITPQCMRVRVQEPEPSAVL